MRLKDFTDAFGCGEENLYRFGRVIYKYVDCGPWTKAILEDGSEVYYEDEKASTIGPDTKIKAIVIGSIVEGWDGDGVGPVTVTNPKNLSAVIDDINQAACRIWHEVNEEEEYNDMLVAEIASDVSYDWRGSKV